MAPKKKSTKKAKARGRRLRSGPSLLEIVNRPLDEWTREEFLVRLLQRSEMFKRVHYFDESISALVEYGKVAHGMFLPDDDPLLAHIEEMALKAVNKGFKKSFTEAIRKLPEADELARQAEDRKRQRQSDLARRKRDRAPAKGSNTDMMVSLLERRPDLIERSPHEIVAELEKMIGRQLKANSALRAVHRARAHLQKKS